MFVRLKTNKIDWSGRRRRFGRRAAAAAAAGAVVVTTATAAMAADGTLDTTFGSAHTGIVLSSLGQSPLVTASVQQPDGKIVVGGSAMDGGVRKFALARFNADGSPDTSFGTGGSALTAVGDGKLAFVTALAMSGNNIIASGTAADHGQADFALARYSAAGALDSTFGTAGLALTKVGDTRASMSSLALQGDGKIVAAGSATNSTGGGFAMVRYNPNGTLDTSFGTAGTTITTFGKGGQATAAAALLAPNGDIVLAGSAADPNGLAAFALARYTPGGALDPTFGTGGKAVTAVGSGQKASITAAVLEPGGGITTAGVASDGGKGKVALVGYTAAGAPDPAFGTNGVLLSPVGDGGAALPGALLRQADGRLVVIGAALDKGARKLVVSRYYAGGVVDASFGTGGVVTSQVGDAALGSAGVMQAGNKLVAIGSAVQGKTLSVALVRYNMGAGAS
jgi:uncharacterized delta-60 repeat protein